MSKDIFKSKIGLFVPCYMDLLYPEAALKSLKFLEHLNLNVSFLYNLTCCGQPFFNSGETEKGKFFMDQVLNILNEYDYIIVLAASCTSMVKNHYQHFISDISTQTELKNKVYEFTEFLYDIYKIHKSKINLVQNKKVSIVYSCHGLRELQLAKSSELRTNNINKVKEILNIIQGLEIVEVEMWDETFSYYENDLSVKMGKDLLNKFINKNINTLIGYDLSCLTHLKTITNKQNENVEFFYIGEILYNSLSFIME